MISFVNRALDRYVDWCIVIRYHTWMYIEVRAPMINRSWLLMVFSFIYDVHHTTHRGEGVTYLTVAVFLIWSSERWSDQKRALLAIYAKSNQRQKNGSVYKILHHYVMKMILEFFSDHMWSYIFLIFFCRKSPRS